MDISSTVRSSDLSLRLAEFATTFDPRQLPRSAIHAAERAILDGIGVMLAASGGSPEVIPFLEVVRAQPGSPQATLLGFGERATVTQAAMVNGALAHALDFEDAFDLVPLHPNASLLPASLAICQVRRCSGPEFVTAVALGCDIVCRLGLSLRDPLEAGGWYPPPILGAFGAAAAAARLLKLDARGLCDAWSLLLAQNSCPGEIKHSPNSTIRAVREAFPAQAAVTCALLAERGVRGFDAPFEGRAGFYALFAGDRYDETALLNALGHQFFVEQLSFKPWPCCRGTHAYIEAARYLKDRHEFGADDVERVRCIGSPVQQMLAEPLVRKQRPLTAIDAKFSIPFTVASALIEPTVTLESFTSTAIVDPKTLALAARCEFTLGRADRIHAAGGELVVTLKDGRTLQHVVERAAGDPSHPLSDQALRGKFIDCASRAAQPMARESAGAYADRVLSLWTQNDASSAVLPE